MMMENIKQILGENGRTISNEDRGLASMMMDNEPRMQDRSAEGQMFSLESEIKNLMKEYEIAVRDGDNERAQRIANIINELDAQKIGISGGMADKNMDKNPEQTLKAIELQLQTLKKQNIQAVKNNDFNTARLISKEENKLKQIRNDLLQEMGMSIPAEKPRPFMPGDYIASPIASGPQEEIPPMPENFSGGGEAEFTPPTIQELISKSGMVLTNSDREIIGKLTEQGVDAKLIYRYLLENKKKESVQQLPMMMAEGGEAQMQMSEQEAMAELEAAGPDFEIVEQLIGAVVQMIQQGVSEAEVKEFLREQGLDEEDIQELFEMVMERLQQASVEEPIGRELQGMM